MQITEAQSDAPESSGLRSGNLKIKSLLRGVEGTINNYTLGLGGSVSEYAAPRHRHNFEQVRYNIDGEIYYGDKILAAGWVGYFPESVYYGPQIRKLGSLTLSAKFGGSNGNSFVGKKKQVAARDELRKTGEFKNGVFSYVDAEGTRHNQDAFEAVFQKATGSKLSYSTPRYDDIVLMNPAAFAWVERADKPGLAEKWIGTFTEQGTSVGIIRLDKGASFNTGLYEAPELLFLVRGVVECDGCSHAAHSAFGLEPREGAVTLKAGQPSEFFCLRLPRR